MKRLNLIMIILWCVIGAAILAMLVAGVVLNWQIGRSFGFGRSEPEVVVDETVDIDGIDTVKLSFAADNCRVFLTEGDDRLRVMHYARGVSQDKYAKIERADNVLTIYTRDMLDISFGFAPMAFSEIEIYLPASYKEKLDIGISSGTVDIDDAHDQSGRALELSELNVSLSSGTVRVEKEIRAPLVNIGVTSGTIRLTGGMEADQYAIKTSSGTITVGEKLTGSGDIGVTSGTVRLSGVDIAETLNVRVSSGTINIGIKGDPGLQFTGRKSSGTIHTYFGIFNDGQSFSATTGEAPYKHLDVQVTSGTVRITQD